MNYRRRAVFHRAVRAFCGVFFARGAGLLPDNWNYSSGNPCLYRGGNCGRNQNYGVFYLNYNSASNANANIGCRHLVKGFC